MAFASALYKGGLHDLAGHLETLMKCQCEGALLWLCGKELPVGWALRRHCVLGGHKGGGAPKATKPETVRHLADLLSGRVLSLPLTEVLFEPLFD